MSELKRPNPLDRICPCALHINTPAFWPSRPVKPSAQADSLARDFSVAHLLCVAPPSKRIDLWDRTHGLLLRRAQMRSATEGITRESLPRTGRATLVASSSTGMQWCQSLRPAAGWSAPCPLGRLAPALPGPLHPTSTTPSHVFHAGFEARVPYGRGDPASPMAKIGLFALAVSASDCATASDINATIPAAAKSLPSYGEFAEKFAHNCE